VVRLAFFASFCIPVQEVDSVNVSQHQICSQEFSAHGSLENERRNIKLKKRFGRHKTNNMRTVKRESIKLNQVKFEALERIARATASDKQIHLDFYQDGLNFSAAKNYRVRRNDLKRTDHHAWTPLSVHASDLAVKEAFETEKKYWAAIAADIHPRIGSRQWTEEQKHYAFWLPCDEHRFSLLILDRAPINEKIGLTVSQRRQVQNYLRRRAKRIMKAHPRVKIARSFVLDNTLYSVIDGLRGQGILISSLDKGRRVFIPLKGAGEISGNIRIVIAPESRQVEIHVSFELGVPINTSKNVVAGDVGLTEVLVDDEGNHYGKELGDTLKRASGRLNEKGKKRNRLHALAKKYDQQGKKAKARNVRRRNLGNKKSRELKHRRITLYTPKEEVKRILLEDYKARLEHRNASSSDEKIRTMTVPGQTLERDKASETRSSRQSKSETATGKSTKSVAIR
jgi:hypothetical protein